MYGVMLRLNLTGACDTPQSSPETIALNAEEQEKLTGLCEFECPVEVNPVCDSRGITHKSQCKWV